MWFYRFSLLKTASIIVKTKDIWNLEFVRTLIDWYSVLTPTRSSRRAIGGRRAYGTVRWIRMRAPGKYHWNQQPWVTSFSLFLWQKENTKVSAIMIANLSLTLHTQVIQVDKKYVLYRYYMECAST